MKETEKAYISAILAMRQYRPDEQELNEYANDIVTYVTELEQENAQLNEIADSLGDELHAAHDDQHDAIMGNNRLGA